MFHIRSKSFAPVVMLVLLSSIPARAMSEDIPVVDTCDWPTAVKAGYYCTGAYVGNQIVVTAAHCVEDGNLPGQVIEFGETPQEEIKVPVDHCVTHPGGEPSKNAWGGDSYDGVDLAYCVLEYNVNLPRVPVLVPGCESEYIGNLVYMDPAPADVEAIGMGCNDSNCNSPGYKRAATFDLQGQRYAKGSWKLDAEFQGDSSPMRSGDSGGPLMVQMADGTWRVIGVYHGTAAGNVWERVPPYLRWIEQNSGRDITPCHDWNGSLNEYVFDGDLDACHEIGNAVYPDDGSGSEWPSCMTGEKSQKDECSSWDPPGSFPQFEYSPSGTPGNDHLLLPPTGSLNRVAAGAGDDVIIGGRGNDLIIPGSGHDYVHAGAGDDFVVIFDACELERGETILGGPGNDTLVTPLSLRRLQALEITVRGFEKITIDRDHTEEADCRPHSGSIPDPRPIRDATAPR